MKIKSNLFYFIISILGLLLVGIFTISQSQVNNSQFNQNKDLINKFNRVVYGLGEAINFTASLTPDYQREINKPKLIQIFNNPLKNGFQFAKNVSIDKTISSDDVPRDVSFQTETLDFKARLRKRGFFIYRQGSDIYLGWQSSKGKRFSFTLPYK